VPLRYVNWKGRGKGEGGGRGRERSHESGSFYCGWSFRLDCWSGIHDPLCCSTLQCVAVCCWSRIHVPPAVRQKKCVSQCVTVRCSVVQGVAMCCSVADGCWIFRFDLEKLEIITSNRIVTHCNTLQHTATHGNTLQHTATHWNTLRLLVMISSTFKVEEVMLCQGKSFIFVLQCVAVCCSVLQCVAVCCNVNTPLR